MKLGTRPARFAPLISVALFASLALTADAVGQPERSQAASTPPWQRSLSGDAASRVEKLEQQIAELEREGRFTDAVEPAREVAETRTRLQGADHWQAADAQRTVDDLRKIANLPEQGRKAITSAGELARQAEAEHQRGHYAESERIYRDLTEIYRKWLGEDHPKTASSYDNLAGILHEQGKYAQVEQLSRKSLALTHKVLGEDHPQTAASYDALGSSLFRQGKYAEAEPLVRKALAIRRRVLGEDHADTAMNYNNLASNLIGQGRYDEAVTHSRKALAIIRKARGEDHPDTARLYSNHGNNLGYYLGERTQAEPLLRAGLAIRLKVLGEDHPDTARSYDGLAVNLGAEGMYTEAEALFRKSLANRLKTLAENHPDTAGSYSRLAENLDVQGKHADAESLHRKTLAIRLKRLAEGHPDIGFGYNHLALNLDAQGKHVDAEPLHRKALVIAVKATGEDNPRTVSSYIGLALNLDAQGKHADAEAVFRKVLAINLKPQGGDRSTALIYNSLASNLDTQGRLAEAVVCWTAAAALHDRTRGAQGASGLERSLAATSSPLSALAIALARQGKPRDAWGRWETDLARGLLDDLSARQLRPLTTDQRRRETDLASQLQRLDEQITCLAAKAKHTQEEDKQVEGMRNQQSALRGQWVEFRNALDQQYQAYAGKPSTLEEVQKALPTDAALVGWLDRESHHWACVVRRDGDPAWVRIAGTGKDGAWTVEDDDRPGKLRDALAGHQPDWRAPAEALARQRLAPLMPHLKGVTQLIVLPSQALAGVPIETLVACIPHGDGSNLLVSYAPSGSMFARLTARRSRAPGPPRLLALGDPAFPKPAPSGPAPTPPDHGIAILAIAPNSTGDLFDIKAGDVLLEYNGKALASINDLAVVPAGDKAMRVPVKLWRDGDVRSLEVAAGPLGILSNPDRPVAQVVLAQRAAADVLRSGVRADGLTLLPGTRREVQAIAALFPKDQVTMLLDRDATESNVQVLARSGALKGYRFIHLATHGKANASVALSSAVFLAAEPDRPVASSAATDPAALESAPDGQVTAEQIVRSWDLDADLVVLSACESGLGRYAGGEGYLGFAQALFVKGARSLVLSQWRVDDKATSLLMTRLYQNLLGNRLRLSKPMPKAEALHEAKEWLRNLTQDEVGSELAALDRGSVRPLAKDSGAAPRDVPPSSKSAGVRPYAHPYYWAAFILIGDPN